MKKHTLLLILISAISLALNAQQKKVAVYVTGENTGVSKILGDRLVDAFTNSGKYVAIERTASFLAELSREQSYQRTGAVSDVEISRLGEQFGVDFVCVADLSEAFGEKYVSARLIDVETAEVVNSSNASSPMTTMDELMEVTSKIAGKLTGKTVKELAEEKAAQETQNEKRRVEAEGKIAAFEKKCAENEAILQKLLANGFLKVGNYFVTFPQSNQEVTYQTAVSECNNCRTGGFSNWRLPNRYEAKQIHEELLKLYQMSIGIVDFNVVPFEFQKDYSLCRGKILKIYERFSDDLKRYCDYSAGRVHGNNPNEATYNGIWSNDGVVYYAADDKLRINNTVGVIMLIRDAK